MLVTPPINANWLCAQGVRPVSYVDTVQVLLAHWLPPAQESAIRQHCGKLNQFPVHKEWVRQKGWLWRLLIQRPTPAALNLITQYAPPPAHKLNRVDIALDVLCCDQNEANEVQAYMEAHVVQRWRGKRQVTNRYSTRYYGDIGTARNFCVYSDRPSKATGNPCCHVESRLKGTQTTARFGMSTAGDLVLAMGNLRSFWASMLVLEEVCPRKLKHRIGKTTNAYWRSLHVSPGTKRRRLFPHQANYPYGRKDAIAQARKRLRRRIETYITGPVPADFDAMCASVSVQGFKDALENKLFLPHVTVQIDNSVFLP